MQKILRYAHDIVLFTTNRYFTFIEAVNLVQTLYNKGSLNGNSTTHILAGLPPHPPSPHTQYQQAIIPNHDMLAINRSRLGYNYC